MDAVINTDIRKNEERHIEAEKEQQKPGDVTLSQICEVEEKS